MQLRHSKILLVLRASLPWPISACYSVGVACMMVAPLRPERANQRCRILHDLARRDGNTQRRRSAAEQLQRCDVEAKGVTAAADPLAQAPGRSLHRPQSKLCKTTVADDDAFGGSG